jgi:hypothetical protein
MKLLYRLKAFFWSAGLPGALLLFYPILILLVTRGRDLSQAASVDASSVVQIAFIFFCAFIIFRELINFNQSLLKKMIFRSPLKFLFFFNIYCFFTALWSTNVFLTLYRSFECLVFLLLITLTIKKLFTRFTFNQIIKWVIWFAFWNLFVGILFRIKLVGLKSISIPFLPSRLFFPLFFFIVIILGKKILPKVLTVLIALTGLSNKIFIGIAMGFLSYAKGSTKNKILFVIASIFLIIVIGIYGFEEVLLNTLFYGRDSVGIEDASGRQRIWTYMIESGLQQPFLGYGFASGEIYLLGKFQSRGVINSHNTFISAFVNTGLVGLFFLIVFFIRAIIMSMTFKYKQLNLAFLSTTILVFIVSISAPGIGGRVYGSWIPSVFLICLMIGIKINSSLESNRTQK